ncbi:transmembrane protein 256 homolog [Saccoglossus kowalevskii]|uniref:Transmembrane protein 256 homolog n=1 Tax=Saccoglossus kowalevskii TaxID=10224 RepID=A0ABM0GIS4_SACKO|nr:PREDICTED: transmembrane protein 256 homolog [Saccoglossus kowalevskii]
MATISRFTRVNTASRRFFLRIGALSGASAVLLGAHGAHALKHSVHDTYRAQVFDIAKNYHFIHSLALFAVPLCRQPLLAGTLLTSGIVLFSGTCYLHSLYNMYKLRRYTPIGGVLLVAGWLALAI